MQKLYTDVRIESATKFGRDWVILANFVKSEDKRVTTGEYRNWRNKKTHKLYYTTMLFEYWGDLNLSRDALNVLKNRIMLLLERGFAFKDLFKHYPYAMVSYVVFLTKYKYNGDFWGMISKEIGIDKPNATEQIKIGKMILKVFDSCRLDYSVAKESNLDYSRRSHESGWKPHSYCISTKYCFSLNK